MIEIYYNKSHINSLGVPGEPDSKCLCRKCRYERAINNTNTEYMKKKRIERARELARKIVNRNNYKIFK